MDNQDHKKQDDRLKYLTGKLSSLYEKYNFLFVKEYNIYNQDIQLFHFFNKGLDKDKVRKRLMLTFNYNPGDVLWNLQGTDKKLIAELMRIHNRVSGKTKVFGQTLFRGKEFFADEDARTLRVPRYARSMHSSRYDYTQPQLEEKNQKRKIILSDISTKEEKPKDTVIKFNDLLSKFKQVALEKGWIKKR